jgi:hypothetical protein
MKFQFIILKKSCHKLFVEFNKYKMKETRNHGILTYIRILNLVGEQVSFRRPEDYLCMFGLDRIDFDMEKNKKNIAGSKK